MQCIYTTLLILRTLLVADYSKRKAQIQYPQKTNPRISYRLSREEIHKQSQKTGRMWTNYAQIQIGTPMDTIESNEALILNEGSLQKALFNTAYPRLQVPILARQKVWGNWRVDRQSFYQGQWKQRRHITNSRTQLNNMPKFIKGQKIISTTVIPQIDSNHTMELHLQAKQPKMTDTKLNQTRKEPIHLPKISMLPDSQVKRERPTVATSKQLLFPKHTQMYKSQ